MPATEVPAARGRPVLEWIAKSNLFLETAEGEDRWYRYHHLFRDFLRPRLGQQTSAAHITDLHARAGSWFAQNGWINEALHHLLAAGDTARPIGRRWLRKGQHRPPDRNRP